MAKPLLSIQEQLFKGYNDRVPPELVPAGFLVDLLNGFVTTGKIEKRNGYSLVANDVGSNVCQGLKGVQFANETKELLTVFNGTIYKYTGSGNWTSLSGTYTLDTSDPVEIVMANNNVYFFDGTNTVPKYDGTTVSTVSAIPIGKRASWFHNFLFVSGVSATPNRLHISTLGNPEAGYAGADNIDVNPNDGDLINGQGVLKDELLVFKRHRIWSITGFGASQFTVADLNERITGYGTESHRSIVNTGNDLLYMSFLGDVPHIRSVQRTRFGVLIEGGIISFDIENSMAGLNTAQLGLVAGIFDGRKAWFAAPASGATANNRVFVYDTILKGWSRHTGINASVFDSFTISNTPQLYFGESAADSKVYTLDSSLSDNGAAINFQAESRRYGEERPDLKKKYKYLWVSTEETGNYNLTVEHNTDGFTYETLGTINLQSSGSVLDSMVLDTSRLGETDIKKTRLEIPKKTAFYYQLRFSNNAASQEVIVRSWNVMYLHKGQRGTN